MCTASGWNARREFVRCTLITIYKEEDILMNHMNDGLKTNFQACLSKVEIEENYTSDIDRLDFSYCPQNSDFLCDVTENSIQY
jgi:hypothetical protein